MVSVSISIFIKITIFIPFIIFISSFSSFASTDNSDTNKDEEIVASEFLITTAGNMESEEEINRSVIDEFNKRGYTFIKNPEWVSMTRRSAALEALKKNLTISQELVGRMLAKTALIEADAVFDPVLNISVEYSHADSFDRTEKDLKYSKGAYYDPELDSYVWAPDEKGPIDYLGYDQPKPEGYYQTTLTANQEPVTGPTRVWAYNVSVSQELKRGKNFNITYETIYQDTFYVNHGDTDIDELISFGSYEKPWISVIDGSIVVPLPFTKRRYSDPDLSLELAGINDKKAYWSLLKIINSVLLQVDYAFWDLTGSVRNLYMTVITTKEVENLRARTEKLFRSRRIAVYNKAQIESELTRTKRSEEKAWNQYIKASNNLNNLLGRGIDNNLLLPKSYLTSLMETEERTLEEAVQRGISKNPDINLARMDRLFFKKTLYQKIGRARPDIYFKTRLSAGQSNSLFGFDSLYESAKHISNPDYINQDYSLTYSLDMSDSAARDMAYHQDVQREYIVKDTENRIIREINDSLSDITILNSRVKIAERNLALEHRAYKRALRLQASRRITEAEIMIKRGDLFRSRQNLINTRIAKKKAEAGLMALQGELAERYGKETSPSDFDLYRLHNLSEKKSMFFFSAFR